MVAVENYALNNECVPNNDVLRISSYRSVIQGKRVQRERERRGDIIAHGDTRSRVYTAWKASYVGTTCTSIFGLPALVSGVLFVPICARLVPYYTVSVIKMRDGGPHTENHLLFHDCRFRVTPSAWQCTLPVRGSVMKYIRLVKGVSYVIKLCA